MAATVSQAIQRLRRHMEEADPTTILDYLNEVHSDLCQLLPIVVDTVDLTLVADQREYTLAETVVRVWSAEYFTSAQDRRALLATDKTELDLREPNWRRWASSIPRRFYVDRNTTDLVVGLHPGPLTATSGGYPKVTLHVTTEGTLTTGSSLPKAIASMDVYVFGAMARFETDPKKAALYEARYQRALAAEISKLHGFNAQKNPTIIPSWLPSGGLA